MAWTTPEFRAALALACCLLLGACSSTTFFYNRLDFLVPWYVDDYVDLDREQNAYLDRQLEPFLAWHRYRELPRYAQLLAQLRELLEEPVELSGLEQFTRHVEDAVDRVQMRSLDWMLPLGRRLSDAQIEEFMASLEETQRDYEEEYLERDEDTFRDDSYERLLDRCEDYLGRLTRAQKQTLRAAVADLRRSDRVWLEERQQWIHRLRNLLRREPGWRDGVREALATRWQSSSPAYQRMYQDNLAQIQSALVVVLNQRTERQDRTLRRRLGELEQDLLALSQQGRSLDEAVPALAL